MVISIDEEVPVARQHQGQGVFYALSGRSLSGLIGIQRFLIHVLLRFLQYNEFKRFKCNQTDQ